MNHLSQAQECLAKGILDISDEYDNAAANEAMWWSKLQSIIVLRPLFFFHQSAGREGEKSLAAYNAVIDAGDVTIDQSGATMIVQGTEVPS